MSTAVKAQRKVPNKGLDDYPTLPWATRILTEYALPNMGIELANKQVLEPAANRGYMVRVLEETGANVIGSDIHDYGHGFPVRDFINDEFDKVDWVITNPPFIKAKEFFLKAKEVAKEGIAIFARIQWIEGKDRYNYIFSMFPPSAIIVHPQRISLVPGRIDPTTNGPTMYAWYVWDLEQETRDTKLMWCSMRREELERDSDYENF